MTVKRSVRTVWVLQLRLRTEDTRVLSQVLNCRQNQFHNPSSIASGSNLRQEHFRRSGHDSRKQRRFCEHGDGPNSVENDHSCNKNQLNQKFKHASWTVYPPPKPEKFTVLGDKLTNQLLRHTVLTCSLSRHTDGEIQEFWDKQVSSQR